MNEDEYQKERGNNLTQLKTIYENNKRLKGQLEDEKFELEKRRKEDDDRLSKIKMRLKKAEGETQLMEQLINSHGGSRNPDQTPSRTSAIEEKNGDGGRNPQSYRQAKKPVPRYSRPLRKLTSPHRSRCRDSLTSWYNFKAPCRSGTIRFI